MTKILPCPFCGGEAELDSQRHYRNYQSGRIESAISIGCRVCGAEMMTCRKDVPDIECGQIIEAWNQRAQLAEKDAPKTATLASLIAAAIPCGEARDLIDVNRKLIAERIAEVVRAQFAERDAAGVRMRTEAARYCDHGAAGQREYADIERQAGSGKEVVYDARATALEDAADGIRALNLPWGLDHRGIPNPSPPQPTGDVLAMDEAFRQARKDNAILRAALSAATGVEGPGLERAARYLESIVCKGDDAAARARNLAEYARRIRALAPDAGEQS